MIEKCTLKYDIVYTFSYLALLVNMNLTSIILLRFLLF